MDNSAIGTVMPDKTIYVGISPDTGKPLYAMPRDGVGLMSFSKAALYAEELNKKSKYGHNDWRIPTLKELEMLFEHRHQGGLRETFSMTGSRNYDWYWSSTSAGPDLPEQAWQKNFLNGDSGWYLMDFMVSVRYVRG